jgi:DNA polymerase III sliding clamp (beta) subunit (PCNA family)
MSKISLPVAELKPALTGLGKVVSKRATLPVLTHLKIERTKDGWIALTGLKSVGSKLKSIQREHKSSTKELQSVRQTLKGLQGLKF